MQTDFEAADRESGARRADPRPVGACGRRALGIYISYYINGYGRPRTSSDLDRKIRPRPGQPAGSGGVLPATTDQKVGSSSLSGRTKLFTPPLTSGKQQKKIELGRADGSLSITLSITGHARRTCPGCRLAGRRSGSPGPYPPSSSVMPRSVPAARPSAGRATGACGSGHTPQPGCRNSLEQLGGEAARVPPSFPERSHTTVQLPPMDFPYHSHLAPLGSAASPLGRRNAGSVDASPGTRCRRVQ